MKTFLGNSTFDSKEHHLIKYQYKNVITHLALPFSFSLSLFLKIFYCNKNTSARLERGTDQQMGGGAGGWWGGGESTYSTYSTSNVYTQGVVVVFFCVFSCPEFAGRVPESEA